MHDLPEYIYPVAGVREMDRIAIAEHGVPGYTLMQRAGATAFADARNCFPDASRWLLVCGAGNNAGDGYVVARLAMADGIRVSVLSLVDPASLSGDASIACGDFVSAGGAVERWAGELDAEADLLIDALLGSGLDREVTGDFAAAVDALNAHWAPVHALDIPSGVHGDTGRVMGAAVVADLTTTFVGLKSGLFRDAGPELSGDLRFSDLEIPAEWCQSVLPQFRRVVDELLYERLPPRDFAAHKGDFGHVLVIGGGPGMPGAALLCGSAALRAGAGRVSVATHPEHAAALAAARPELMVHGINGPVDLAALLDIADVLAIGPGLGRSDWARALFAAVASDSRSAVWDADALNMLAESDGDRLDRKVLNRIITPHPGEAGRLLGRSSQDVQADRVVALADLLKLYGGTVVLKGAGTLVLSDRAVPYLCTAGNPGMAAPGIGDVLTGIVAAMLAQGLPQSEAAAIGVEVHARAGDIAAEQGERGLLASDLVDALPWVVNP